MATRDFIPKNDRTFLEWLITFLKNLFPSLARFSFPQEVHQLLAAKRDLFIEKLTAAENPKTRTKGVVEEKNVVRKDVEQTVRQAVKQYLTYNPAVTEKDHDDLGLPIHKSGRTPSPVALKYPDFDIDSSTIRRLLIHFYDQGSKTKAKPAGQHGAEIRWVISDVPVVDVAELIHSSFDTRTPFTLEFQGHERGKTVYFCLCWENTRGEKGPWSEIQSAIIP